MAENKNIKKNYANKSVCQYCGITFKRLDLHEPSCKEKSIKVENCSSISDNGEEEEEEGEAEERKRNKCRYCRVTFKRLDLHEPSCKEKSIKVENCSSISDNGEEEEEGEEEERKRNKCRYCRVTFKRLDLHEPSCKEKSIKVENCSSISDNGEEEEEEGEAEERKRNKCRYCRVTFKRLDLHEPSCKEKSIKVENCSSISDNGEEEEEGEEEERKRNKCRYCRVTFKRLDLHEPSCKEKSIKVENCSSISDNGEEEEEGEEEERKRNKCRYCRVTFKRLDLHEPSCKEKSIKVENCSSISDNGEEEEEGEEEERKRNKCRYCRVTFKRLDLHEPSCKEKSIKVENCSSISDNGEEEEEGEEEERKRNKCRYCRVTFKRLDLHEPSCKEKSIKVENCSSISDNGEEEEEGEEEERKRNKCRYCRVTFKRLDLHEPSCKEKSIKVENCSSISDNGEEEEEEGEEEERKRNKCRYCRVTFKRLDLHEPSCKEKSIKVENCSSISDNGEEEEEEGEEEERKRNKCRYCRVTFKRLDLHEPSCKEKSIKTKVENQLDFENLNFPESKSGLKQEKLDLLTFTEFCTSVKLKKPDIICAIDVINDLMGNILRKLKSSLPLKWEILNSGSYYSHVKVLKPDEFDYMMYPTNVKCKIEPYDKDPCFCRVFVTNKDGLPYHFQNILTTENELKPSEFKKFIFPVFEELVQQNRNLSIFKNEVTCPAFTVKYKYKAYEEKEADIDWVPSLLLQKVPEIYMEWQSTKICEQDKNEGNIFVVPKMKIVDRKEVEVWRLSYSFFEKEIIGKKCTTDERFIIRILKKIREEVKDKNSDLCSYHIVTSCLHFFHEIEERPKLQEYTIQVMTSLIRQLKERKLPHFFIKNCNLLLDVKESECQRYIQRLNAYRQKWMH